MSCPHVIKVSDGCMNHEQLKGNKLPLEVLNISIYLWGN